MQLSKYTLHNLAIPWENINNDTLNSGDAKKCQHASSGNPVIYKCSNPGLCVRKFLFLLPHIPTEGG